MNLNFNKISIKGFEMAIKGKKIDGLDLAIHYFGGTKGLAKVCGITPMAIYQWPDRRIPMAQIPKIQAASNDELSRKELRPDIDWDKIKDAL